MAVGSFIADPGVQEGLLLRSVNAVWSAQAAPLPADAADSGIVANLLGAWCLSGSECVAVGTYLPTQSAHKLGLLDTFSNGQWSASAVSLPDDPTSTFLSSVACPAAGSCVAVGNTAFEGVLGTESAGVWSFVPAPVPASASSPVFIGQVLACPSVAGCQALGNAKTTPLGSTVGLIESLTRSA